MSLQVTLVLLALAVPATAPGGGAAEILIEAAERRDREVDRVAAELGALPPDSVPQLFEILVRGEIPNVAAKPAVIELDPVLRTAVLESFGLRSPKSVRQFLAELAPVTPEARRSALAVLAEMARADDVDLILHIASPESLEAPVTREVRDLVTAAFARALERDPRAVWDLHSAYADAHPGLVACIPSALGLAHPPEGLQVLTDLLGQVPEMDPIVLAQIGNFAESVDGEIDPMVTGRVRDHLSNRDPNIVRGAALATLKLDDTLAAPELVRLLRDPDANVRASAELALERISGRDMRGDAQRWEAWYAAELTWRNERGPVCLERLRTRDRAYVAAALNEVAAHRLFRHEFEKAVVATLAWKDPGIVGLACGVIGKLGARRATPELRALSEGSDPAVSGAAEGALRAVLGPAFEPSSAAIKR